MEIGKGHQACPFPSNVQKVARSTCSPRLGSAIRYFSLRRCARPLRPQCDERLAIPILRMFGPIRLLVHGKPMASSHEHVHRERDGRGLRE